MYTAQGKIVAAQPSSLLTDYAPLVRRLALQLMAKLPSSVELDDLIQVGMMGLLDASQKYQDDQRAKFETYATQRIRGAMLDELRANDWASRSLRQQSRQVTKAVQAQEQRRGRAPTEAEIAEEMALPLADYQHLLGEIQGCQLVYYQAHESPDGEQDSSFLDTHAVNDGESRADSQNPLEQLLKSGLRKQLVKALDAMPEREQLLLSLYYEQELNLREIGAIMEVTQSRVCQLHSQAICRLRSLLGDALD